MHRPKLYFIVILSISLPLGSTATTKNGTSETKRSTNPLNSLITENDIALLKQGNDRLKDKVDDLSSRIRTVEDRMSSNRNPDFSSLLALLAMRNSPLLHSEQVPDSRKPGSPVTPMKPTTEEEPKNEPKPAAVTTPSPSTNNAASELLRAFSNAPWLAALGRDLSSQSVFSQLPWPPPWLAALGRDFSPPPAYPHVRTLEGSDMYPSPQSGFPNARWLGALGADTSRFQKPPEIVDYPVVIIPESSFYQIGQPVPRVYSTHPPGSDQYAVSVPTYARPPH
uniref:DUF3300 domain-containing protein n=1 Tax=Haemonchus contortus TaxID=6289 RepID=A0A7I4XZ70_HAECO